MCGLIIPLCDDVFNSFNNTTATTHTHTILIMSEDYNGCI